MAIFQSLLLLSSLASLGYCLPRRSSNAAPAIPLDDVSNSGEYPLPSPTGSLKYIAMQIGTQNYTCNSTTNKYDADGALARVFDATAYLTAHPKEVDTLSDTYLSLYTSLPCSKHPSDCVESDDWCEDQANRKHRRPLKAIGEHYFDSSSTPTFDLYWASGHPFLYGSKVGDVPAPDANDIDWLYLSSNGSAANNIISSVYRIKTAGGKQPDSCSGSGSITVPYASQYWYYG